MRTDAIVSNNHLLALLYDIQSLTRINSNTIPIRFDVGEKSLTLTCATGCYYTNNIPCVNESGQTVSITVLYRDITPFLMPDAQSQISITDMSLDIECDETMVSFPKGYSTVSPIELPDIEFIRVSPESYKTGIKLLENLNLGELYQTSKPYYIYQTLAVQKFPNIIAQVRCSFSGIQTKITQEYATLVTRFSPLEVGTNYTDMLVFKRYNAILIVPFEEIKQENNFKEYLSNMDPVLRIHTYSYHKQLQSMVKLDSKATAHISIYDTGLTTTISNENITTKAVLGSISNDIKTVFLLPIALWSRIVCAFGNSLIEVLYDDSKICLRNQQLVLVLRIPN